MKKIVLLIALLLSGCAATVPQVQFDKVNEQSVRCRAELKLATAPKSKEVEARKEIDAILEEVEQKIDMLAWMYTGRAVRGETREVFFDSEYKRATLVIDFSADSELVFTGHFMFYKLGDVWTFSGGNFEREKPAEPSYEEKL